MRVERVVIEGFGKFEDFAVEFEEGINIVYGRNSTGKTTLASFIRYCLTGSLEGLEDFRPWHSRKFGGKVTVDGKEVRFGESLIDPDEFFFTSFLPESGDYSYEGSEKMMKILKEHRYRTETASFYRGILENSFEGLQRREREITSLIEELEKKLEEWNERRGMLERVLAEKNKLLQELEDRKKKFLIEMQDFTNERKRRLADIDTEIEKLYLEQETIQRELERIPYKPLPPKICEEIVEKTEKLSFSARRREELLREIDNLTRKLTETREKIKELMVQFEVENLEEFKLKIENIKLQLEVLREKKRRELKEVLERLKRPLESIESELNEVNEEMVKVGETLARKDKKLSLLRVFLFSMAMFSLVSTLFSLFSSRYLLILTALGLSLTGVLFWKYLSTKKECVRMEKNLSELTTKRKDLMERRSSIMRELKESIGVEDLNSLEESLRKDLNSEILRKYPYLSVFGKDPESAVGGLEKRLNELLMSKEAIETALIEKKKAVEELEGFMNRTESEVKIALAEMGFSSVEEMREAIELQRKREVLEKELKEIENRLRRLMDERKEVEKLFSSPKLDSLRREMEILERRIEDIRPERLEEPWDILEELYRKRVELALISKKISYVPHLKEKAKKLLEEFLEGYTKEIEVDLAEGYKRFFGTVMNFKVHPNLKVRVKGYEEKPLSRTMSKSCLTLLVFLLKKSVSELLGTEYPLVIDNCFVDLDDERVEKVWELLVEVSQKRQVILFTSDKRFLKKDPVLVLS